MLSLLSALVLAAPTVYALDDAATELVALTSPAGLFAGASHPHVVVARQVEGELRYDPDAVEATRLWIRFPTAALENDDPALRARYGLPGALSPGARREVAANLRSPGQLDAARFPEVSFRSRTVRRLDGARLEVSGTLTVRGVAAEVTLPVRLAVEGGVARGEGRVGLTHAMFGFEPYTAALGTIRNAGLITLQVTLVARAAADAGR